ncbi:MAG TPA: hypothetical protein VII63_00615 [Caulobacteraceae bacterium]
MRAFIIAACVAVAFPGLLAAQTPVQHAPLIADDGPAPPSLIACSYNQAGDYTGADSANPGEQAGGPTRTAESGDSAWRLVIVAADGTACPRHIQT